MDKFAWVIFLCAAMLEVGGDAVTRQGWKGASAGFVLLGVVMLAFYGVTVNLIKWDF